MSRPTFLRPADLELRPACEIDAANDGLIVEAEFIAAQSTDQGRTVTWVCVCAGHACGWNDGGDWDAPVFRIASNRPDPAFTGRAGV